MPFLGPLTAAAQCSLSSREEGRGQLEYALILVLVAIGVIGVMHLSDVALPFQLPEIQIPVAGVGVAVADLFEGIRLP
ncbi:MAG: hypothetical protein ACOC7Y_02890 [Chloroflexota bacterium]